jgi:hypothetical protein
MQVNRCARFKASSLAVALLISFNLSAAQEAAAQEAAQSQQTPSGGVRLDPSAGPLTPGEPQSSRPAATQTPAAQAPLPDAPQPQQPAPAAQSAQPAPQAPQAPQQPVAQRPAPSQPLGAAAAEQIKTAGGGASRPAGNAIAPAKQHQYRSMLIKLGAVAAAGVAVGTVYGLSRATPSVPPHSAGATK